MGRKPRIWQPGTYYHIVCRGNRRDALFLSKEDYICFFKILENIYAKMKFELPAYCLMTNHYHLMIRTWEKPVSKVLALLNKRYADYFNNRYRVCGHLFEKRYFDQSLDDDKSVLEVSRYIHRNPFEARIVKKIDQYTWSSYYFYTKMIGTPPVYTNVNSLLHYFYGSELEKRAAYQNYVEMVPVRSGACHPPKNAERVYLGRVGSFLLSGLAAKPFAILLHFLSAFIPTRYFPAKSSN